MDVKQITKATGSEREVGCCGEPAHPIQSGAVRRVSWGTQGPT